MERADEGIERSGDLGSQRGRAGEISAGGEGAIAQSIAAAVIVGGRRRIIRRRRRIIRRRGRVVRADGRRVGRRHVRLRLDLGGRESWLTRRRRIGCGRDGVDRGRRGVSRGNGVIRRGRHCRIGLRCRGRAGIAGRSGVLVMTVMSMRIEPGRRLVRENDMRRASNMTVIGAGVGRRVARRRHRLRVERRRLVCKVRQVAAREERTLRAFAMLHWPRLRLLDLPRSVLPRLSADEPASTAWAQSPACREVSSCHPSASSFASSAPTWRPPI